MKSLRRALCFFQDCLSVMLDTFLGTLRFAFFCAGAFAAFAVVVALIYLGDRLAATFM